VWTSGSSTEPLVKGKFGILEDGFLKDGERRATFTTLEASVTTAIRVHTTTIRTSHHSIGVDLFLNELVASGFVMEMAENLWERVEM
jgi:hypothetical protein